MNAFQVQLLDLVGFTDYMATFAEPGRTILEITPYTYVVDGDVLPAPITATASQSFLTPMDGDCDFVLTYISGFGRAASNPYGATVMIANPAIMVQISELATGRNFFAGPMPMPMIAGQGGFPFLLTSPRVFKPRQTLKTTAISAQVQSFNGFYLCFHGARIWYGS